MTAIHAFLWWMAAVFPSVFPCNGAFFYTLERGRKNRPGKEPTKLLTPVKSEHLQRKQKAVEWIWVHILKIDVNTWRKRNNGCPPKSFKGTQTFASRWFNMGFRLKSPFYRDGTVTFSFQIPIDLPALSNDVRFIANQPGHEGIKNSESKTTLAEVTTRELLARHNVYWITSRALRYNKGGPLGRDRRDRQRDENLLKIWQINNRSNAKRNATNAKLNPRVVPKKREKRIAGRKSLLMLSWLSRVLLPKGNDRCSFAGHASSV